MFTYYTLFGWLYQVSQAEEPLGNLLPINKNNQNNKEKISWMEFNGGDTNRTVSKCSLKHCSML